MLDESESVCCQKVLFLWRLFFLSGKKYRRQFACHVGPSGGLPNGNA